MVDVCDTFCGVETFAAALEMDQMDQMNQSALEPTKKCLGLRDPVTSCLIQNEWLRFIGCRYGQPRIGYQPSKNGGWKLETTLYPHLMSAPPPSSSSSPVSNLSIS